VTIAPPTKKDLISTFLTFNNQKFIRHALSKSYS